MLGALLTETGATIDYASDGKEALKKIWHTRYDMVFMDILMPVMRGDEAIDVIRKEINQPKLTCVAISAFSLAHEIKYYLDIGFDEFIPKPFLFSDIYRCLTKFSPNHFEILVEKKDPPDPPVNQKIKLTECHLSEEIYQQLTIAAELNRLSHLKELIDGLTSKDPAQRSLGNYLLKFIDNYDMDGFLDALEEVNHV